MGSPVPRIYTREMDLNKIKEAINKIKLEREYLNAQDLVDVGLYLSLSELHSSLLSKNGPKKLSIGKKFAIFSISEILSFIDKLKVKRKKFSDKTGTSGLYIINTTSKDVDDKPPRHDYLSAGDTNSTPKPEPTKDYRPVVMELNNKFSDLVRSYNMMVKESIVVTDKIEEIRKLFIEGI